jgi:hypothetical protein
MSLGFWLKIVGSAFITSRDVEQEVIILVSVFLKQLCDVNLSVFMCEQMGAKLPISQDSHLSDIVSYAKL